MLLNMSDAIPQNLHFYFFPAVVLNSCEVRTQACCFILVGFTCAQVRDTSGADERDEGVKSTGATGE